MKRFAVMCLSAMVIFSGSVFAESMTSTDSSVAATQVVRTTKRKTHYVKKKSKKVGHRTWNGTKWVYSTSARKTHKPRRKTWRTGRKVVSRTKKVFN